MLHPLLQQLMNQPRDVVLRMPRREYESLQLQIIDDLFQSIVDAIPALQTLAGLEGITKVVSFEQVARLCFPDQLFKSYDQMLLLERNWPGLTAWLNNLVPVDLTEVDHTGIQTLQDWIDLMFRRGIVIMMSSATQGKPSFYPRTVTELQHWIDGVRLRLEYSFPGITNHPDLAGAWPSFAGGNQVSLLMNQLIFAKITAEGKHHNLYPTNLQADALVLASQFAYAKETGNQAALQALMPAIQRLQMQRESGAEAVQRFLGDLIQRYGGTDQAILLGGGAPDILRLAQGLLAQGVEGVFNSPYILTGGGFKGETPPADWREIIARAFGTGAITVLYSGKTEDTFYNEQQQDGRYLVSPFSVTGVIAADGRYLPREGEQHGIVFNFDPFRSMEGGTWGGTIMRDLVTMSFKDRLFTGTPERALGAAGITCSAVAQTQEQMVSLLS